MPLDVKVHRVPPGKIKCWFCPEYFENYDLVIIPCEVCGICFTACDNCFLGGADSCVDEFCAEHENCKKIAAPNSTAEAPGKSLVWIINETEPEENMDSKTQD